MISPVASVAAASKHHVSNNEFAAGPQPLERLVDRDLLVPVAKVVEGVFETTRSTEPSAETEVLDRHGSAFYVRDALLSSILEQQSDHLLAHVDAKDALAILSEGQGDLTRAAPQVNRPRTRCWVGLAKDAFNHFDKARVVRCSVVPARRSTAPETLLSRNVAIGARCRLRPCAHELDGLNL